MADPIDMNAIYQIESSLNPKAINARTKAYGLGQVTPIVVADWNNMNPKQRLTHDQMLDPLLNQRVSSWYMNQRIPQMLSAYRVPDTTDNRLIAYNAGIGYARKGLIPDETKAYLTKYKAALQSKKGKK